MHTSRLNLTLGLQLIIAAFIITPLPADDRAWSSAPASALFSGDNWCDGTGGANCGFSINPTDALYFNSSAITSLINNLQEAEFASLTFNPGATSYTITGNSFSISGPLANLSSNPQIINNNLLLGFPQTLVDATGDLLLGGIVSGNGRNLYKAGTDRLTLSGVNSYTGSTIISKGTLALGATGSIAKSTNINLAANTILDVSAVPGGFHVATGQTVGGKGTIIGPVTVDPGGRLVVTDGAGAPSTLITSGDLVLKGATVFSIKKDSYPAADVIQAGDQGSGTLTFGGTLVLRDFGTIGLYELPRTFTLFKAANFSGAFTGLVLQNPSDGAIRVDLSQLRAGGDGTIRFLGGNQQPTASDVSLTVERNGSVSFELAKYASDPDGDLLTPTFEQLNDGESVTFTNGVATYRPPLNTTGNRSFVYKVTDPSGVASSDPATSAINVTITTVSGGGANILSLSGTAPGPITVSFAGIPGGIYQMQFSSDLSGWSDVGTLVTVGGNGKGTFEHATPPEGSGYYRTRWVRYGP